jgi:hypothetical protein
MPTPAFIAERHVEEDLRDGVRLPDSVAVPLARAVTAVMARADDDARRPTEPQLVVPGSLGSWAPDLDSDP